MTVAYTYFRVKTIRESHKSFAYCYPGLADVPIIWDRAPAAEKGDMGNSAGAPATKEPAPTEDGQVTQEGNLEKLYMATLHPRRPRYSFMKIIYVVLSVLTIFKCIAVIAVSVSTAIATKTFSIQQSGRLVAMIILAVTAAVTLSMVIYAVMAVFRKQTKPLHAAAVVLVILAIIQTIICTVSVNLTTDDEVTLVKALLESFRMAREENPRHVKLWSMTQSDLQCCGIYSPDDYRSPSVPVYFPPDVPISCCSGYVSDRSELLQERERESCKARREYYGQGCRGQVVELFRNTAALVLSVSIVLILLEITLATLGTFLSRKQEKHNDAVLQELENSKAKI